MGYDGPDEYSVSVIKLPDVLPIVKEKEKIEKNPPPPPPI